MTMRFAAPILLAVAALAPAGAATASDCPNAALEPDAGNEAQVASGLLCAMNAERTARGLVALRANAQLRSSAHYHADDMAFFRYFAHRRPDGPSLLTRIRATGYFDHASGGLYTENLADAPEGNASPQAVVEAWMASDHHRANLLTPGFRDAGIAFEAVPADPAFYPDRPSILVAVDYGRRYRHAPRRCRKRTTSRAASSPSRVCRKRHSTT